LLRICQLKFGSMTGPSGQKLRFAHVVVDEAQDLSPLSIQVLCGLVPPDGPVTLAGDTAQRLVLDNGFADWDELAERLHLKAHVLPPLAVTYRSTRQVMALARHVLGPLAREEAPRDARDGAPVELLRFPEQGEAVGFLADALKSLLARERRSTVALVARTPEVADVYYQGLKRAQVPALRRVRQQDFDFSAGVDVTDVMQIKGLEYDYVVALEATAGHYPSTDEARFQLHVIMTRAAHQLWLVCSDTPSLLLPESLTGA
ncbi:MAG: ATP-binding domain-containing protein, partial [Myxococcales bacterium]|nr:ATP-binding domain-containing protein [Myxococcales bacterium]